MSNDLSVEALRTKIINLITNTLSKNDSVLTQTLNAKINDITKKAIDADNENDINWDETDQLFGDYTGAAPTGPAPASTEPSPDASPQLSIPPVLVSAKNGDTFAPGNTILIISGRGGITNESIQVTHLPDTCRLTHDVPQVSIISYDYNWTIHYSDGTSVDYIPRQECVIDNISSLYNTTITIDTENIPGATSSN